MSGEHHHICVCVCTFRRPHLLERLLQELSRQLTDGRFTYSIVVADNDCLQSAREIVSDVAVLSNVQIRYCVEPQQNIALARNKALEQARGDFVCFIDDDEFPTSNWLLTLFEACNKYEVDGVLGPVKPYFDEDPPHWVVQGKFYERPTYPTGFVIDWAKGRTGNVLLRRRVLAPHVQPFRPQFLSGEDQDFFKRMIEQGHRFIWCNEAVVYEVVPPIRWKPTFMLKRALLQGAIDVLQPSFGILQIAKSLVAVLAYTAALPFMGVLGYHRLISCMVKLCDHVGKLLALAGIHPIGKPYITE